MGLFAYRARDQKGILITGHLEGGASGPVKNILAEQGLIPLSVKAVPNKWEWIPSPKSFQKVRPQEIVLLTRQFYTLFKAGMTMENLLATLSRQTKNILLRETIQRIQTDISQGSTLSNAFAKHPKIFDNLYISMLAAGEEAGILEEILKNLADLLQKEIDIKSGVKSATLYPKLVIGVLMIATTVMMVWVVPQFAKFYAHYKSALPIPTRILTGVSHIFVYYGWAVALAFLFIYILYRRYNRTPSGKLKLDQLRWKIPIFGALSQKIANARFSHILSALYRSGFSITKGLSLVEGVIENEVMVKDIRRVRTGIERGQSLSEAMKNSSSFSPILVEATAVGEKTGALDDMLQSLGEHYDTEITYTIKNLTTLLEPFLLFFIFGMVAFFAMAIVLPIWNVSRAVMGG